MKSLQVKTVRSIADNFDGGVSVGHQKKSLISFCLPCYNVKDFIGACIDSIVCQKELDSFEILCIDDRSTDGTYDELLAIQASNSNVRVLQNEENKGVSFTRNRLLRESLGEYIWFVDPDDLLYPNIASTFLVEIKKNKCDALLGNFVRIKENEDTSAFEHRTLEINPPRPMGTNLPNDTNGQKMCAIWAGLFNRGFLVENSLIFNEKMSVYEDMLFYFEIQQCSEKIYKIDTPCYFYRERTTSVMHTYSQKKLLSTYFSTREMLRFFMSFKKFNESATIDETISLWKQSVVTALASLQDRKFIKSQLEDLRSEKIYPYKFRKNAIKDNDNILLNLLRFLLPIKIFFWIYHLIYQIYFLRKTRISK